MITLIMITMIMMVSEIILITGLCLRGQSKFYVLNRMFLKSFINQVNASWLKLHSIFYFT